MEEISKLIEGTPNEKILIIAHSDHDGICSSFALNYLFGKTEVKFSRAFKPQFVFSTRGKKLLLICDLLLSKEHLTLYLEKMKVINFDHHDIIDIPSRNYLCLNPKKLWNKEFISSSGLIWKLFKPKEIAWLLAAGSAGDLAIEDVLDLFKVVKKQYPELINDLTLNEIYNSKIFEIAQMILVNSSEPAKAFSLLYRCAKEKDPSLIFNSELYKKMREVQEKIKKELEKIPKFEGKKFVLFNTSSRPFAGSYSGIAQLSNNDDRIHIEYANGRLFFRNYLGKDSIMGIAKLFNGGGAHSRAGGAYTRKSFDEVKKEIENFFNQSSLENFRTP